MDLFSFIPLIMLFIYVLIFGFAVYFLVNVLQFMRKKNQNDRLLLQKVDELSRKIDELKSDN